MTSIGFSGSGWPSVTLEKQERNLIFLGSDQKDNALLTMKNHAGERVVQVGVSEEGYGYVGVHDQNGRYPGILLPTSVR